MTYEASPERSELLRFVARVIFCVGAIIALWLIEPTAARALEPSSGLDEPLPDAVNDTVDSAEATLTEAAGESTGTAAEAADANRIPKTVTNSFSAVTSDVGGSGRGTVARVEDLAEDPASILEEPPDTATDVVVRPLQDAVPTVDLDGVSTVVATVGAVTASGTSGPRTHDGDRFVGSADREDVSTVRPGDEPSFAIRGPPLPTGPITAATSDGGTAPTSSSGESSSAPGRSDALPAAAEWTARPLLRDGSSFNDLAAILAALMIALGLVRLSVRESEFGYSSIFFPLAERPG